MRLICVLALFPLLLTGCGRPSSAPVGDQIGAVMLAAERDGAFSGNVLVTRGGAILYQHSFGMADRATRRPNRADTPFLIASLSKPVTAVLVLRLVEQGKLKLATRLDQVFPQAEGSPVAGVTVAQLLSHTSGIEEVIERHLPRPLIAGDLRTATLSGSPGRHVYSSSGYVILKLIAERVTGVAYADLLDREILAPAGMTQSGVLRDGSVSGLALAYATSDSDGAVPRSAPLAVLDGAGSLYSTVGDLMRFDQALTLNRLLKPETMVMMNRDQTGSGGAWGYGWALDEQDGQYYPWHRGDFDGYHALMVRQTRSGERIFILSNLDRTDIGGLKRSLMRILKQTRKVAG